MLTPQEFLDAVTSIENRTPLVCELAKELNEDLAKIESEYWFVEKVAERLERAPERAPKYVVVSTY